MNVFKYLSIVVLLFSFISCGGDSKKWVSDLTVETAEVDNEVWVVTDFKVEMGENILPTLKLPVNRGRGSFRSWNKDGENYLGLDLNVTDILNLPAGNGSLPNGQPVPVDTNGAGIIEMDINGINGKLYLAKAGDIVLVGLAATISQLDGIAEDSIGIFPFFDVNGYKVTAGIFTSRVDGENGIAIFATLGNIWNPSLKSISEFEFRSEYVSRSEKRQVYKKLRRMMKKRMNLQFN